MIGADVASYRLSNKIDKVRVRKMMANEEKIIIFMNDDTRSICGEFERDEWSTQVVQNSMERN